MQRRNSLIFLGSCILLGFLLAVPFCIRWYLWRGLPTLAAIPVEDVAAIEVNGAEFPIGDLRFILSIGTDPEFLDSSELPVWNIQMGERRLKMLAPKFWRTWDATASICCEDPKNTPYTEQLRQVYSVSNNPHWMWMRGTDFHRYSQHLRCAWGYRSPTATKLMIMPRSGYHICVVQHEGQTANISVIDDESQKIWGLMVFNFGKNTMREELIDFASRIRLPQESSVNR